MKVAVAADHAGLDLKQQLAEYLREQGHEVHDLGNHLCDPADDYPDFSEALASAVAEGRVLRVSNLGCTSRKRLLGLDPRVLHDLRPSFALANDLRAELFRVLPIG